MGMADLCQHRGHPVDSRRHGLLGRFPGSRTALGGGGLKVDNAGDAGPLRHLPRRIPIIERPGDEDEVPGDLEYFAINVMRGEKLEFPFRWERVARLNMDRTKKPDPQDSVIVGRRIQKTP